MTVEEVMKSMPDESLVADVADLFKVLGDSTRARILTTLEIRQLCVSDLARCLNMTKSAVSHQLRILRQSKLVKATKEGKEVIYALDDEHVSQIFDCAITHILE